VQVKRGGSDRRIEIPEKARKMKFSIVICSYNRKELLEKSIRHTLYQSITHDLFEVIVVDNMSTDGTWEMLEKLVKTHTGPLDLRVVQESKQGLSHARNRGIAESKGEWILFLDDDALAAPDLLACLDPCTSDPKTGIIGGTIAVKRPDPCPIWLGGRLMVYWSDYRPETVEKNLDRHFNFPFGANFCVRQTVFDTIGEFNHNLGRQGRDTTGGEEVDLCFRAKKAGFTIVVTPEARVDHVITPDRFTLRHCFRAAWSTGKTWVYFEKTYFPDDNHIWKFFLYTGYNLVQVFNLFKRPLIPDTIFRMTVSLSKLVTFILLVKNRSKTSY